ncbi:MAG TPA: hypothetical protein VFQ61_15610 [Polyangiaceae bacterium]|nr:hypothetical protein [Polyangiaceae bacterium]
MNGTRVHQILLVPGFFGFGRFGEISYFNGVADVLTRALARQGIAAQVNEVATVPTASIRVRAARVLEALERLQSTTDGPIHIIGHSTGGLDARLAIAPTASLPTDRHFTAPERLRTLVTVCCPHFGTPIATFFCGGWGRALLRVICSYLVWLLLTGRLPLRVFLKLGYWIVRVRDPFRKRRTTFDEVYEKLLNDLSEPRRQELAAFLKAVAEDQSLVFQLTPAGCDLLNACTAEPNVHYASVVARAERPSWRYWLSSVWDLYTQMVHPFYGWLHRLSTRAEVRFIPAPVTKQAQVLEQAYGRTLALTDSDGLVPTLSQVWGDVIHAARADHLDVVGQFGRIESDSWAGDWLPSHSGFDRSQFDALWSDVARYIATHSERELPPNGVGTDRTDRDLPDAVSEAARSELQPAGQKR